MKKIATLLVILGTMTCHVMAQEINVESLLKKADEKMKREEFMTETLPDVARQMANLNISMNELTEGIINYQQNIKQ